MASLKELRTDLGLTQKQVADLAGVSLRSYKTYENDESKRDSIKYKYIVECLNRQSSVDEENGVLTIDSIVKRCTRVLKRYDISFCYLFGSYAKGTAGPMSDVDLLIAASITGLQFYGLVEELRTELGKKVDVLNISQLDNNLSLTEEILRDGIKIYG